MKLSHFMRSLIKVRRVQNCEEKGVKEKKNEEE